MADAGLVCAAQMYAVPSALNAQVVEHSLPQLVAEYGVVGGIDDAYARHPDVAAVGNDDGMRPAHTLLAKPVAHVAAVDGAAAPNAAVVGVDDVDESERPLGIGRVVVVHSAQASAVAAEVLVRAERLVAAKLQAALDYGLTVEPERDARRHMERASDEDARRHHHPSPALLVAMGQGSVDGDGIVSGAVADGAKRKNIDNERQEIDHKPFGFVW